MKSNTGAGAVSGCIVWLIVFGVLGSCLLPVAMMIGGFTSFSEPAIQFTGSFICPEGTTPDVYSYPSTTTDEYGNTQPSTAYELHCLDAAGDVVKKDPVGFGFLWIGIFSGAALIVVIILAFLLAAPAGLLVARLFRREPPSGASEPAKNRSRKTKNIEPD